MNCGCNDNNNITNNCKPKCQPTSCACAVRLNSDCITVVGATTNCSNLDDGLILTDFLSQLDEFICTKFAELTNYISLINVGTGAEVYKGINGIGQKEIRKINAVGDLIIVTQNADDISISIDETALDTFIEENQLTYSMDNVGTGAEIFKDTTVVGDNAQFNLKSVLITPTEEMGISLVDTPVIGVNDIDFKIKTLETDTLIFDTSEAGKVKINTPNTASIPAVIVNNGYIPTYLDWFNAGGDVNPLFQYKGSGTIGKPYTNSINYTTPVAYTITPHTALSNGVEGFVGSGSRVLPEHANEILEVQAGIAPYEYTDNIACNLMTLLVKSGTSIASLPSAVQGWFLDADDASLGFIATQKLQQDIIIEKGGFLFLDKNGVRNSGTSVATSLLQDCKIINITGEGDIYQTKTIPNGGTPGDYIVFGLNQASLAYNNDGQVLIDCRDISISSPINPIFDVGGRIADFKNVKFLYGLINGDINPVVVPYRIFGGGYARTLECEFYWFGNQISDVGIQVSGQNSNINLYKSILNGTLTSLILIEGESQADYLLDPYVSVIGTLYIDGITTTNLIDVQFPMGRTNRHVRSYINGSYFSKGEIDDTKIDLTGNNVSSCTYYVGRQLDYGKQIIQWLVRHTSRASAITAGLEKGATFTKYTTVTAGSFVVGEEYKITTVGTTDFVVEQGASSNAVGTWFVATVAGTGTGTADKEIQEIIT